MFIISYSFVPLASEAGGVAVRGPPPLRPLCLPCCPLHTPLPALWWPVGFAHGWDGSSHQGPAVGRGSSPELLPPTRRACAALPGVRDLTQEGVRGGPSHPPLLAIRPSGFSGLARSSMFCIFFEMETAGQVDGLKGVMAEDRNCASMQWRDRCWRLGSLRRVHHTVVHSPFGNPSLPRSMLIILKILIHSVLPLSVFFSFGLRKFQRHKICLGLYLFRNLSLLNVNKADDDTGKTAFDCSIYFDNPGTFSCSSCFEQGCKRIC